jgi:hypothetical protein
MPYAASGGIYTGPTGSTGTLPGQVIRSATWNTINSDYATALTTVGQQLWNGPVTITGNYTVATTIATIIANAAGTATLTLPSAATVSGHRLNVKTVAAQAVVSASSNVVGQASLTQGTAILVGTAGKWAQLQSDGTNWVIVMSN